MNALEAAELALGHVAVLDEEHRRYREALVRIANSGTGPCCLGGPMCAHTIAARALLRRQEVQG